MSSIGRGFSQIPPGSKYMFVPRDSTNGGFTPAVLDTVISSNTNLIVSYDGTVLNTTDSDAFLTAIVSEGTQSITLGNLYRDMGKQLHLYQNGVKTVVFRLGQKVEDPDVEVYTEGVGTSPNIYLCTWQSQGSQCPNPLGMIKVVRTG
jgi:hypothetical protein